MRHIQALLFDKDGTLFDFHATWGAWAVGFLTGLAGGDEDVAAELGAAIGFDLQAARFDSASPVIAGTPWDVARLLTPHLPGCGQDDLIARMNAAAVNVPLRPSVPLGPLLRSLAARGLALGVATNDAEAPARAHLAQAGVLDLFACVIGCDSGYGAKPDPGPLRAFAQGARVRPAQVLMIGDSRHDLRAGRAAGMGTVGVLTGPARAEDLADLADAVLPDIGYLPAYLDACPAPP
ncbi:phosphoglycolate phosphatase [Rhodovulum imhoffii]|uniref:phosphoglycolate phosphatase n=1 Tax=Rhodovulum imhoffii TaxID=365340 RepID=A0A2T5BQX8_9RHOB|nr:HAD family hydrolase [Rhodovulum imhoffii]MBK5932571.1 phosphatase [Rhodovulum imhoffii]PTN01646.1 phosphoglycolate phosphatase [Rhodovulum imhoffii]